MSIAALANSERVGYLLALACMEGPHLIEREAQYINTHEHGFLLVRETPDGWWLEHEKPEKNTQKQMQRHLDDDTVAYAWSISPRFTCKGGWAMDD